MDACLQQQYPPFFQLKQERPTLRANARQREVVFKRVKAAPQPARSPASLHHEALGKAITRRTLDVRAILARRFRSSGWACDSPRPSHALTVACSPKFF